MSVNFVALFDETDGQHEQYEVIGMDGINGDAALTA
jgi:hypothetical protein